MKLLIIEDEPRAASQLQRLLEKSSFDFQVLTIIDTVEDSVVWFKNNAAPDLVIMDIQLADGLSFEIFQNVEITAPIIFSQAVAPAILQQLLKSMQTTVKRSGILVKEGSGFVQVKTSELLYVYSQDSITFGVTSSKRYIIDETMDQLFNSLDDTQFFRINRGQIVSKTAIEKIDSYFNHRVKLAILNPRDQEFIVSRLKTNDFKEWMNV